MEAKQGLKKIFGWRNIAAGLCMAGFITGFLCMFTTGTEGQLTWVNIVGVALLVLFGRATARLIGDSDE